MRLGRSLVARTAIPRGATPLSLGFAARETLEDALEIRRRVLMAFERAEREPDPAKRAALLTFADLVEKVSPAVVSINVKGDSKVAENDLQIPGLPDIPEDSPLYDFFKHFRQGQPNGHGGEIRRAGRYSHYMDRRHWSGPGWTGSINIFNPQKKITRSWYPGSVQAAE